MVEFAGYEMPVQYSEGILAEHLHTRAHAGLFDVSHMGQVMVSGEHCEKALEAILPVDLEALPLNHLCYTVFTNPEGGVRDDLIVTRRGNDAFMLVVNAACKMQDIAYLESQLNGCKVEYCQSDALLALQGPKAQQVLVRHGSDAESIKSLSFMQGVATRINGVDCYISRSGYTGEDGFELSIPNSAVCDVAELLLADDAVQWIGLGARDSLRLEAGLCLYGHDMNEQTTPPEAGLGWSISPSRRANGAKAGGFPGAETIFAQQQTGVSKKRVGLLVEGRAPVREGSALVNDNGDDIGVVTSGGFSPTLERPIAMAYIATEYAAAETQVNALVRGKPRPVKVTPMPFVRHQYKRQ